MSSHGIKRYLEQAKQFSDFLNANSPAGKEKKARLESDKIAQAIAHLAEHGWAVVPGVVSKEKAKSYFERFWEWLASLGTGIEMRNSDTWTPDRWPYNMHGIFQHFNIGHSQFVWDIRDEEGVIEVFARIWGTHQLLVSFDGGNLSRPRNTGYYDRSWFHTDQGAKSPLPRARRFNMHELLEKAGVSCVQGFLNLNDCGPEGGGLEVLDKSHMKHGQFFEKFPLAAEKAKGKFYRIGTSRKSDGIPFDQKEMDHYSDCPPVKVCCAAGDLVLWDSRTIHHAVAPIIKDLGQVPKEHRYILSRAVVYTCYMPNSVATENNRKKKREAYRDLRMTNHWASMPKLFARNPDTHGDDEKLKLFAVEKKYPTLSERAQKMASLKPY